MLKNWIKRYKGYGLANQWQPQHYARFCSAVLQGEALDVLDRLPSTAKENWEQIQEALRQNFRPRLLEHEKTRIWRNITWAKGEPVSKFYNRLIESRIQYGRPGLTVADLEHDPDFINAFLTGLDADKAIADELYRQKVNTLSSAY